MGQEGYAQIPVKVETQRELIRRKMNEQAKSGKPITWDDFLLEKTKERKS